MIALTTLWANPLVRKIALYGGIAVVALLLLRWWGNAQWAKGEAQGRLQMAEEITKAKTEEWEAREAEIEKQAAAIAEDRMQLEAEEASIRRDRANLSRSLSDGLKRIEDARNEAYIETAIVPDDELWGAIRIVSGQLSSQRGGEADSPSPVN